MADPHLTVERVLEKFGTREALIDFLLDTKDIDNVKKKLINPFIRFRKVYNKLLPESSSRQQNMVSQDAGQAWDEQKVQNPAFWADLDRDFRAEHEARFPVYWQTKAYVNSLPPAERKAYLATVPNPNTRSWKKRSDVEGEQTPRDRAAPYTVPSSSSSSRFRSSRSSKSSSRRSTLQASSSAVHPFPTPPTASVHPATHPSLPMYPSPHPPVPMFPSTPPSHMMPSRGHVGWQASAIVNHTMAYGNAPLDGGQYYMAPTYPTPVAAYHPPPLGMHMQSHPARANATVESAASYHQPFTVTATHSAQWTASATVPVVPYYPQPIASVAAPPVPYHETGFGYGTYQVNVGGDAPPLPALEGAPFPSHQWASPGGQAAFAYQ